jgi:hypothetical protein
MRRLQRLEQVNMPQRWIPDCRAAMGHRVPFSTSHDASTVLLQFGIDFYHVPETGNQGSCVSINQSRASVIAEDPVFTVTVSTVLISNIFQQNLNLLLSLDDVVFLQG